MSLLPLGYDNGTENKGQCACYKRYHMENSEDRLAFWGFGGLALLLLTLCALIAGLTLAIGSLDIVWLQILSITGSQKQRNQTLVILRIKRHASWFLCSMIICAVACTETLPILIQSLFGTGWLPIVISTVAITILAELLPQYLIPRHAIFWGYYCWPFIWGCMWFTGIISWPLAFILDKFAGSLGDKGIYSIEQLGVLIQFHGRTEKHGGLLGPDAVRIMRGALDLDGRMLRGNNQTSSEKGHLPTQLDVERGNAIQGDIIIPWASVRSVGINEEVTKELILRVKSWAYSRIPVVGDMGNAHKRSDRPESECQSQNLYGFLHVKNLIGLELADEHSQFVKIYVRDLPLYPLPVVRDDLPLYDLLNMFQLGISRMAVVIPKPVKDKFIPLSASAQNEEALPRHGAPLWSAITGLNNRNTIEMCALDEQIDWTTDFLDAAQNDMEIPQHRKQSLIGIGCPKAIGIVTYEDILDTLLQKATRDEKDFFERGTLTPNTKRKKAGNYTSVSSSRSVVRTENVIPAYVYNVRAAFEESGGNNGTLRRRNISTVAGRSDGLTGITENGFDGANDGVVRRVTIDNDSSYTQNSGGGFHSGNDGADCSSGDTAHFSPRSAGPINSYTSSNINMPTSSLEKNPNIERPSNKFIRPGQPSRGLISPKLRRVTPFSQKYFSKCNVEPATEQIGQHLQPMAPDMCIRELYEVVNLEHFHIVEQNGRVDNNFLSIGSTLSMQENLAPLYPRRTLPSLKRSVTENQVHNCQANKEMSPREESFHDDRTLLPSQRKLRNEKMQPGRGRFISL